MQDSFSIMATNALSTPVKVTPALAKIIGTDTASRSDITKQVWVYIKAHGCQNPDKKSQIIPDATMAAVFGDKPLHMTGLPGPINQHIVK